VQPLNPAVALKLPRWSKDLPDLMLKEAVVEGFELEG